MAINGKEGDAERYTAEDIQVLEGMEAVRRRPGMYIGSTDQRGLHHLIYEIVDNSVDEFMGGFSSSVDIAIAADGTVRIEDDGPGAITAEAAHRVGLEIISGLAWNRLQANS